jgi:hypothetical protein
VDEGRLAAAAAVRLGQHAVDGTRLGVPAWPRAPRSLSRPALSVSAVLRGKGGWGGVQMSAPPSAVPAAAQHLRHRTGPSGDLVTLVSAQPPARYDGR